MTNPIQRIVEFNKKAGLLDKQFSNINESSYLIEEALEGFGVDYLTSFFRVDPNTDKYKKNPHRAIAQAILCHCDAHPDIEFDHTVSVASVDKFLDAIIYGIGGLAKQGLSHQDISHLLNVVNDANMHKIGAPKDSEGKQLKPDNWEKFDPEPKIHNFLVSKGLINE